MRVLLAVYPNLSTFVPPDVDQSAQLWYSACKHHLSDVVLIKDRSFEELYIEIRRKSTPRIAGLFSKLVRELPLTDRLTQTSANVVLTQEGEAYSLKDRPGYLSTYEGLIQGIKGEPVEEFFQRVFDRPFRAARSLDVYDRFLFENLGKSDSGARWLLEKKLPSTNCEVNLFTQRFSTGRQYSSTQINEMETKCLEFIRDIKSKHPNFNVNLKIMQPSRSRHDRFMKLTFASKSYCFLTGSGLEVFHSQRLSEPWAITSLETSQFENYRASWD